MWRQIGAALLVGVGIGVGVGVGATAAWAGDVAVELDPDRAYAAYPFDGGSLSLLDAVALTLQHTPNIYLSQQDVRTAEATTLEALGAFDPVLKGTFSVEYTEDEISEQLKRDENKKRDELREDAIELAAIEDAAADRAVLFAAAQDSLTNDGDLLAIEFPDTFDDANWRLLVQMYESDPSPEFRNVLSEWIDAEEAASIAERDEASAAREEASRLLRNFGAVPRAEKTYRGNLRLELAKKYRIGPTLTPFVQLNGGGNNFVGKRRSAEFGGKGADDNYKAQVGFRIDAPLGNGWGLDQGLAKERAAEASRDAAVATAIHTASVSVFQTVTAYWNVVGAESKLALAERSRTLNARLSDISRRLSRASRIPRMELTRAEARLAEAEAFVEASRRQAIDARVQLANAIGLELMAPDAAPLASDGFPAPVDADELRAEAFAAEADAKRLDLRAARLTHNAARITAFAADEATRPDIGLGIEVSASALEEDNVLFEGLGGAIGGRWTGPSAKLNLEGSFPLGNNVKRGRADQSAARAERQRVTAEDLARRIRLDTTLAAGTLRTLARAAASYSEAVDLYRETMDNTDQLYDAGKNSLQDTINTEERLVRAETDYIDALQRYAIQVARLRFEMGGLVYAEENGGAVYETDLFLVPPTPGEAR